MTNTIKHIAPWLAAAAAAAALFLAPVASAATTTQSTPGTACISSGDGQVYGQQGGCTVTAPNGPVSPDSNLPYDDAGNSYQHAGAV